MYYCNAYGPSCSSASQVNGNLSMLKPHPLSRARCTSAEPSSTFNGLPMKLSPPSSAVSQNPSRMYDGLPIGFFEAPERLTPLRSNVRPLLSTKLQSAVCMYDDGVDRPVTGETCGTLGMFSPIASWN